MKQTPTHGSLATALAGLQQIIFERGLTPPSAFGLTPAARGLPSAAQDTSSARVLLIAASKTQPVVILEEAIQAGVMDFGENKVQEAAEKWPQLKTRYPNVRLHLIGPLQSNKAAEAVALFDVIQTLDRPKIAEAVAAEMEKQGRTPALLIQVNIGEEPQKAGVSPAELPALLEQCQTLGLTISGLMAVPPADKNPAPYFALMQKLAHRHRLPELSIGMSGDFETALRFGATMVRIGTALFGERKAA